MFWVSQSANAKDQPTQTNKTNKTNQRKNETKQHNEQETKTKA